MDFISNLICNVADAAEMIRSELVIVYTIIVAMHSVLLPLVLSNLSSSLSLLILF